MWYIVLGLVAAFFAAVAWGAFRLNRERDKHEKEIEEIKKREAEHAQKTADAITEAERIKESANTGNHSDDLHTMADQLHKYNNPGK